MIVTADRIYQAMKLENAINIRNRDPVKLEIGSAQIKAFFKDFFSNSFLLSNFNYFQLV